MNMVRISINGARVYAYLCVCVCVDDYYTALP